LPFYADVCNHAKPYFSHTLAEFKVLLNPLVIEKLLLHVQKVYCPITY